MNHKVQHYIKIIVTNLSYEVFDFVLVLRFRVLLC